MTGEGNTCQVAKRLGAQGCTLSPEDHPSVPTWQTNMTPECDIAFRQQFHIIPFII